MERVVTYCVEGALNDFLHHLDAEMRRKNATIQVTVNGKALSSNPEKLGPQLWGPTGWLARYGTKDGSKA